jgi:hypothetical protein
MHPKWLACNYPCPTLFQVAENPKLKKQFTIESLSSTPVSSTHSFSFLISLPATTQAIAAPFPVRENRSHSAKGPGTHNSPCPQFRQRESSITPSIATIQSEIHRLISVHAIGWHNLLRIFRHFLASATASRRELPASYLEVEDYMLPRHDDETRNYTSRYLLLNLIFD